MKKNKNLPRLGIAFSVTAAAIIGAAATAAAGACALTMSSIEPAKPAAALLNIVPDQVLHPLHGHPHDMERQNVSGDGAITLPSLVVNASVGPDDQHHEHEEHPPHPEHKSVRLTGQAMQMSQSSMGPGTLVPLAGQAIQTAQGTLSPATILPL